MVTFQTYNVTPTLPAALEPLREMSFNLWWTWEPSARRLFRQLDPELWDRTNHNPVRMLQLSRQSRLEEISQDKAFLRELRQVFEAFEKDGNQEAINLNQNFHHLPIREVRRGDANLLISVPILNRGVFAKIWELRVGRVNLYLLDTDTPENSAEDRLITAELYGGDLEMRMRQEIILGIGGVKALSALGIKPDVFHVNEGHSAFLALERIRLNIVEKTVDFYSALQVVAAANVFTTHTPVPAGNDSFPREMMRKYYVAFHRELNIPFDELFSF